MVNRLVHFPFGKGPGVSVTFVERPCVPIIVFFRGHPVAIKRQLFLPP